jgi:glycosyltransferase involved in cell wall biosynthesis
MVEKTGGGLLVAPDDPAAVAEGLFELWRDPQRRRALADRAFAGVRTHYSIQHATDIQVEVYESLASGATESRLRTARHA